MIIHEDSKSVLLRLKNPDVVSAIIPKSKPVDYRGHNLAVKHGVEETKVLRNLGIKVPPPIKYHYDWPGVYAPFKHQKITSAFITLHRRGFVLNEQGTAKTASMLWAIDFLMREGLVNRVLIVSPLSTIHKVWQDDAFKVVPHRVCSVLHAARQKRLEWLAIPADIYVVNHDGFEIIEHALYERPDIDMIVIDEGSAYTNSRTARWKAMQRVTTKRSDMWFWIMTGTPCAQAPTQAWALAKLISPERVPSYFGQFQREIMLQVGPYKWIPKQDAYKRAFEVLQPAIRFKKDECLDLPPMLTENRETPLSKEQQKAYNQMRVHMAADVGGESISAVNAADRVNKLRQVLCGVVKVPGKDDEYRALDFTPRLNTLLECIEEASAKVLVVVPFKGIIRFLADKVREHYSCELINGDVPLKKRNQIINAFKGATDPHVLLVHPEVASHGLNFVEADTCVFYAPIYSNDEYQQVIERINRPGQTRKMTVVRIGGHPLEWSIYRKLDERQNVQSDILDLYRQEVLGM